MKISSLQIPAALALLWRILLRPALIFAGIPYLALIVMFASFQRSLIYYPARGSQITLIDSRLADHQIHPVRIQAADDVELHGWHVTPHGKEYPDRADQDLRLAEGRPVILYFSGNGGHRGYRGETFRLLTGMQTDLFVFDYRGYGENAGTPSEAALHADARQIWKYLTISRHIDPGRIILYGESLGGAVATRLAADLSAAGEPPGGLILCAAFSSLAAAGQHLYPWLPVSTVLIDRYESVRHIPRVTCPILQIHGARDTLIPLSNGEQLFAAAPAHSATEVPKIFVTLPDAGHNDIVQTFNSDYYRAVTQFLKIVGPPQASPSPGPAP